MNAANSVGAVAGTPGTVPTRWVGGAPAGITREILGTGVEDGIEYIDIRYSGTPSSSSSAVITFEPSTNTPAADAQVWAGSYYIRLVGGSVTNTATTITVSPRDSGGVGTGGGTSVPVTPTSAPLRTQRATSVCTAVGATTAGMDHQVRTGYTIALPIDITLRIGLPQLEMAESGSGTQTALLTASSPIKTSTVAVNRGQDIARITDPRALTDKAWIISARSPAAGTALLGQPLFSVDDGTNTNRKQILRDVSGNLLSVTAPAALSLNWGALTTSVDFKVAMRMDDNNTAGSLNGAAVLTDNVGLLPVGLTTARIGTQATGHFWFSTIRSIETRATASDAELVALSTL